MSERNPVSKLLRGPLGLVLLIALAARCASVFLRPDLMGVDTDGYLDIARHLARGLGFSAGEPPYLTAFRPPLYPLFVAPFLFAPNGLTLLAIAQIVLGTCTVWLTYQLAVRVNLSRPASLVTAAFVACDPILIHVTATAMTETLCTFLIALWGLQFVRTDTEDRRCHLLSGVLLGLLCLCRPTFLPFVGLVFVAGAIRFFLPGGGADQFATTRKFGSRLVIQVVCAALVVCPWLIRNGVWLGKWTPATTHGGYTLLLGNNSEFYREVIGGPWNRAWSGEQLGRWQADLERQIGEVKPPIIEERDRDAWFYRTAMESIRAEPRMFLQACLYRLFRFWDVLPQHPVRDQLPPSMQGLFAGYFSLEWLLAVVGLIAALRSRQGVWWGLIALIVSVCGVHLFYWTDLRMRAPLMPLLAVLAGLGWEVLFHSFSRPKVAANSV
ncbi:MAG: glycosyltransferase family 39 protein [Planctomycetales bacterium]